MKPIRKVVFMQELEWFFDRFRGGVERVAVTNGWVFTEIRYSLLPDGGCRMRNGNIPITLETIVDTWDHHGIIVECATDGKSPESGKLGHVPVVFINPAKFPRGRHRSAVLIDHASFARVAASELLQSGWEDFAFVPFPGAPRWSRERERAFAEAVQAAGKRFHRFPGKSGKTGNPGFAPGALEHWLRAMPKPVGIFAANDICARDVANACTALGLAVPDDVAIIGVDNRRDVCEKARPTLSSIAQDLEGEGHAAATLLARMLEEPDRTFPPVKWNAGSLVRRESTRFRSVSDRDGRVARALEFIRLNACSGIGPDDVAKAMFASRSVAYDAFTKATGSTILAEIHAVRLAKAREMLTRGILPDIVAQECGYGSVNDFRRVFKRRTGTTIRRWIRERRG